MSAARNKSNSRETTRRQLILAAEALFAESGIDAVSLRQINVAAGQKNSSAAHYHFGSKQALILSIYQNRMTSVNVIREQHLAQMEVDGTTGDVRALVEAIVLPIVTEIDADTSGQNYIRFMAQAMGHPQLDPLDLQEQETSGGLFRTIQLMRKALPDIPGTLIGQRFGLAFEQIVHSLADREKIRRSSRGNFSIDSALFVSNLIDVIAGSMSAPISPQTQKELDRITKTRDQAHDH